MNARKVRTALGSMGALVFGLVVTYLALSLAGAVPGLGGDEKTGGHLDGSKLLTSARDRLAICVQTVGIGDMESSVASQAKTTIESTLADLAGDPVWVKEDLGSPPPVVDVGCPVGPAAYDPQAGPRDGKTLFLVRGRDVGQASYYRVFVFVLPDAEITRLAGSSGYRLTSEEFLCEVDACAEVTAGIYLRPAEVAEGGLLEENLRRAVGLQ